MKNPNGYGTVVKLSGNRRKPYAVRKTIGFNKKGYPIYQSIGYTETREKGMEMLALYNHEPWNVDRDKITLKMLYEKWKEVKSPSVNEGTKRSLQSAYKHCDKYYDTVYRKLRSFDMQDCIDNCGCQYSTQWSIKNLFGHLDRFAFEIDIINKMYSLITTAPPVPETTKEPFTDEEIKKVYENKNDEWIETLILYLFTGFRLNELLSMELTQINLETGFFNGGSKSKSGKNRFVPIHSYIQYIVKKRIKSNKKYLIEWDGKKLSKSQYYIFWNEMMEKLQMNHTPHECRHTFRSKLDSAKANKKCIDLMMGHKSKDVGERTYTHKTFEELKEAIELIKFDFWV
jgi:integrase|nr:MAG TPA: Integrase [Caudoviricetes sp.]